MINEVPSSDKARGDTGHSSPRSETKAQKEVVNEHSNGNSNKIIRAGEAQTSHLVGAVNLPKFEEPKTNSQNYDDQVQASLGHQIF